MNLIRAKVVASVRSRCDDDWNRTKFRRRWTTMIHIWMCLFILMARTAVFGWSLLELPTLKSLGRIRNVPSSCPSYHTVGCTNICSKSRGNILQFSRHNHPSSNNDDSTKYDRTDLSSLEEHVMASVQSQMDISTVMRTLYPDDDRNRNRNRNVPIRTNDLLYDHEDLRHRPMSQIQVATAAAMVVGCVTYLVLHNLYGTGIVAVAVFVTALVDDDDDNNNDKNTDSFNGALARIVGRSTIRSVQASQPKIKAVARAVLTGEEEILHLKRQVRQLEDDNAKLRQWKETRIQVEDSLPRFTVAELKDLAKFHGLPLGGSKVDLLCRLVEARKLYLD
jgi:SAP domain